MPDDLVARIGKREIWRSYGDISVAQVRRLHDLEMAKWTAISAEERQRILAGDVQPGPIRSRSLQLLPTSAQSLPEPTEEAVRAAVLRWFHGEERRAEAGDRAVRSTGDNAEAISTRHEDVAHLSNDHPEAVAEREHVIGRRWTPFAGSSSFGLSRSAWSCLSIYGFAASIRSPSWPKSGQMRRLLWQPDRVH